MRQMIKGLVAAFAVMTAGTAAPAMACGYGGCCGALASPCATTYAPAYTYEPTYSYVYGSGCGTCGNHWAYERLAEPTTQYYYVNQGPIYSGPGMFAPEPTYQEDAVPPAYGYGYRHRHHAWHHQAYRHHWGHEGYYASRPLVRRYY
jgi:hypothetical protein